jgi:hypothetical protein
MKMPFGKKTRRKSWIAAEMCSSGVFTHRTSRNPVWDVPREQGTEKEEMGVRGRGACRKGLDHGS